MALSDDQIERYSRQIILPEVGGRGQTRLLRASALLIGCGGLGTPCAQYLAAAGVGRLILADSDAVELNNLQRQILHATPDVGRAKVESAAAKLRALNPDCAIEPFPHRVTPDNVFDLMKDCDVVVDGSDNFRTRYLMNDACVLAKKPLVHAGILRWDGQALTIIPGRGPCYRCLFPDPPEPGSVGTCAEAGILGAVAGILGAIQAAEALKILLGAGEPLVGRLFTINAQSMTARTITIARNPRCVLCGDSPTLTALPDYDAMFAGHDTPEECRQ